MRKYRSHVVKRLIIAAAVAVGICLLSSGVIAALIAGEQLPFDELGYAVVLVLLISSFAITRIMITQKQLNKAITVTISLAAMILILLMGNWFTGADGVHGFAQTAIVAAAGTLAALLGRGEKKRKRHRIKH